MLKARWSRLKITVKDLSYESYLEVDGVIDRPDVYKISMVRMYLILTNFWMYGSKRLIYRNVYCNNLQYVWISKNWSYESPYSVIGTIKHTGLKKAPKDICKDRNIGTWKALNMEMITHRWNIDNETINYLNQSESSGIVPMKLW